MYSLPRYEFRRHEANEWKEISELEIMNELYKSYNRVTPIIKEMISGKEVQTPKGLYRLK